MTITRDECGRPYCYDVVAPHIDDLLGVKIDVFTESREAQNQITDMLKLKEAETEDALRGIRNAVVEILSSVIVAILELADNTDAMWKVQAKINGITAVIDNELWNRGYRV